MTKTDNTQDLDEILAKHNGELGLPWEDPDVVTSDTKQALLDWHDKQIEAELEALREEVKHEDLRTISQMITARIDKLKERDDE